MAAFSKINFFASGALFGRAATARTPLITQRSATELAEFAARVGGAIGELVLFLWTMSVLAFSLLVMAGFLLG